MSQDYYRTIAGKKYDRIMLEIAEEAMAGRGDGRISLEDAQRLIDSVKDANKYTDIEKATMRYIRDHYHFTPASDQWFRKEIRRWAATKSRRKRKQETPGTPETPQALDSPETPAGPPDIPVEVPPPTPPPPRLEADIPPIQAPPPTRRGWADEGVKRSGKRRKYWTAAAVVGGMVLIFGFFIYLMNRPESPEPPDLARNTPEAQGPVEGAGEDTPSPKGGASPPPPDDRPESSANETSPQSLESPQTETEPEPESLAATETLATTTEASWAPERSAPGGSPATGETPAAKGTSALTSETSQAGERMDGNGDEAGGDVRGGVGGGTHQVKSGDTLWRIAGARYQAPILWPFLYHENRERLPDPNLLLHGMEIVIPVLEGSASNLSTRDRERTAQGYLDAYRAYRRLGRKWARDYLLEAGRWDPAILEKVEENNR